MTPLARTLGTALAAGSLVAALAACSGDEGSPGTTSGAPAATSSAASSASASTTRLTGQRADLELKDQAERALARAGVSWDAEAPARKNGGDELRLPVTGGSVSYEPLAGTVRTSGSGVAGKDGRQVRVTDVEVDLDAKSLSASVAGQRMELATLDTSTQEVEHTEGPVTEVDGIDVTFTADTVRALNGGLGTSIPSDGITAELELHLTR